MPIKIKPHLESRRIDLHQWACKCVYCNKWFVGYVYNQVNCKSDECLKAENERYKSIKREWFKNKRPPAKKPEDPEVKFIECKRCGRNAYPNFMYCKPCHKQIERQEGPDTI